MATTVRRFEQIRSTSKYNFTDGLVQELSLRLRAFEISQQQIEAWTLSFDWLWESIQQLPESTDDWLLLPEFNPPLSPIRPDVVIFTGAATAILEFKAGLSKLNKSAQNQVLEYANEMYNTMKGVRSSEVLTLLVSPSVQPAGSAPALQYWSPALPSINQMHPNDLEYLFDQLLDLSGGEIVELASWMHPTYDLHPDIVRAASELIAHVEDRGVVTHLSDDEELDAVRDEVLSLISEARNTGQKRVILVSGVPGAGKTLVGLRLAHDPDLHDSLPEDSGTPLYLTGNGPLVDVLVEAVARDDKRRNPERSMTNARREAGSKIKLVHAITENSLPINSHVVIFDEGQRVWTAEHMRTKGKTQLGMSEGDVILKTLEKHNGTEVDWAALVVLIGSGQEINQGEAGARVWSDAVANRNALGMGWDIFGPSTLESELADALTVSDHLHLKVSRRAQSASALSDWVSLLLSGQFDAAHDLRITNKPLASFPLYVTRDLDLARDWLRTQVDRKGNTFRRTSGLVASSKSARLRVFGLEVGTQPRNDEVNWTKWFLDKAPSLHASSRLEVAASEFKTQGLELDYVGVAWSWDLILDANEQWQARKIDKNTAKWSAAMKGQQFRTNAYRVLLTRCRAGMIIFVPHGEASDSSINASEMDTVYATLIRAGVEELDSTAP